MSVCKLSDTFAFTQLSSMPTAKSNSHQYLLALVMLAALWLAPAARSQCPNGWLEGETYPGTDLSVYAMTIWDPDGLGPLPSLLVMGGSFSRAGGVSAQRVAAYNPTSGTWTAVGDGLNGSVFALTSLPNGHLVAGGDFTLAGGVPANRIALWNGSAWTALGGGMSARVSALTSLPNGDIVAGGDFITAGGSTVNRIARWNGSTWLPLGSGMNAPVHCLATLPNAHVVAGGSFTVAGGVSASYVARFNGISWLQLGSLSGPVKSLALQANGDVLAGGRLCISGRCASWRYCEMGWQLLETGRHRHRWQFFR